MIKLIIVAKLTQRLDQTPPILWCFDALKSIDVSGLRLTINSLKLRATLNALHAVSNCALQHLRTKQ